MYPYPRYDDDWVLIVVNRAMGEGSTTVTESGQEDNPFGHPSVPPSEPSEISSYFHEQDLELEKILRSDAPLDLALLGPNPADIAGLAVADGYHDPEQYLSTSMELAKDASMVDAPDPVENFGSHHPSNWPSSDIPFRPSVSGPDGLLAPPPSHTRRPGGRSRNAIMNWNSGTKEGMSPRVPKYE